MNDEIDILACLEELADAQGHMTHINAEDATALRHAISVISASSSVIRDGRLVSYKRALELIGDAYNAGTKGIGYTQQTLDLLDAIRISGDEA